MMAVARVPFARLTRVPRAWIPMAVWIVLALGGAYVAERHGAAHAADHVLLGAYGAIALPLLVYGVVTATLGGDGLASSGRALIAFGAAPAAVTSASVVVAALASALLAGLLAGIVAAIAHTSLDPPLASDMLTSAWIGALGGAAYAAYFMLGSSFGARGAGRAVFLVLDWILGSGEGGLAVFFPRAHVRNLLGGEAPLELAQPASVGLLFLLLALFGGLAVVRVRR
jgi:hypothetical protein